MLCHAFYSQILLQFSILWIRKMKNEKCCKSFVTTRKVTLNFLLKITFPLINHICDLRDPDDFVKIALPQIIVEASFQLFTLLNYLKTSVDWTTHAWNWISSITRLVEFSTIFPNNQKLLKQSKCREDSFFLLFFGINVWKVNEEEKPIGINFHFTLKWKKEVLTLMKKSQTVLGYMFEEIIDFPNFAFIFESKHFVVRRNESLGICLDPRLFVLKSLKCTGTV